MKFEGHQGMSTFSCKVTVSDRVPWFLPQREVGNRTLLCRCWAEQATRELLGHLYLQQLSYEVLRTRELFQSWDLFSFGMFAYTYVILWGLDAI
jgi:hypothetical protein